VDSEILPVAGGGGDQRREAWPRRRAAARTASRRRRAAGAATPGIASSSTASLPSRVRQPFRAANTASRVGPRGGSVADNHAPWSSASKSETHEPATKPRCLRCSPRPCPRLLDRARRAAGRAKGRPAGLARGGPTRARPRHQRGRHRGTSSPEQRAGQHPGRLQGHGTTPLPHRMHGRGVVGRGRREHWRHAAKRPLRAHPNTAHPDRPSLRWRGRVAARAVAPEAPLGRTGSYGYFAPGKVADDAFTLAPSIHAESFVIGRRSVRAGTSGPSRRD
jgi:hypothetical protein